MIPTFKTHALITGLLAALPLGACGGIATPPVASSPDATTSTSAESVGAAEQEQATPPLANQAQPNGARLKIVPFGQLRGLTNEQLTEMLGTPQFLRNDSAVELWQYRADGCVLSLFLYRSNGGLRVQHAEVRPRSMSGGAMNGAAADACLTKLTAAPQGATS